MSSFDLTELASNVLNKDGSHIDPSSLNDKIIGLYFSAHWCGPCRNFTPKLAKRYEDLLAQGEKLEIIFVSADEDSEQANDYFQSMPWKMLDFEKRDLETSLSRQYEVRGIPTLVVLDSSGNLLTTEGRELLMEVNPSKLVEAIAEKEEKDRKKALEIAELKSNFNPAKFFATRKVVDGTGTAIDAQQLEGKLIGLYFSAHWCPPCRGFTPVLAEKYKNFIGANAPFEIIFISSDRDTASAASYFAEMPWKMLSYDDRESKGILNELFEVSGIPTLILLNETGVLTDEGREAVTSVKTFEKLLTYVEDKKVEEAKLAEKMASAPDEVTVSIHPHPLRKLPSVYRGSYGCDHCAGGGSGWVYHCDECGFDVHPACVFKLIGSE